jgi:hypothetical protein
MPTRSIATNQETAIKVIDALIAKHRVEEALGRRS